MTLLGTGTSATTPELEAIDRIVDYAFWQLMLQDDLGVVDDHVELLCVRLRARVNALHIAVASGLLGTQCIACGGYGVDRDDVICSVCHGDGLVRAGV